MDLKSNKKITCGNGNLHYIKKYMDLRSNKGIALPTVLMLIAIMLLLGITIVMVTDNDTRTVANLSDSEEALHIAEAGYNRYLWYLNDDTYFYRYEESKDDETMGGFRIESRYGPSDGDWSGFTKAYKKSAYKNGNVLLGYYQIEIVPPTVQNPVLGIRSTGWTADESHKRTIYVEVSRRTFTSFVEFSHETPSNVGWGEGEIINGPYFTNGVLRILGKATFKSSVGYAAGIDERVKPNYEGGPPVKKPPLQFPASNSDIQSWASDKSGGYTYNGRTCIHIDNSTLYIRNKGTDNDSLKTRDLPQSGVIYVNGELFLSGKLDGRLTIVVEGNIYICGKNCTEYNFYTAAQTNGITYADSSLDSDDMLGLIFNKDLMIVSRYWPDTSNDGISENSTAANVVRDMKIHAAILGIGSNSSYTVQDYNALGDMGYIYLFGSKATKWVKATFQSYGSSVNGYRENNTFDTRMLYDAPPHFLEPINSGWEVVSWKELN